MLRKTESTRSFFILKIMDMGTPPNNESFTQNRDIEGVTGVISTYDLRAIVIKHCLWAHRTLNLDDNIGEKKSQEAKKKEDINPSILTI